MDSTIKIIRPRRRHPAPRDVADVAGYKVCVKDVLTATCVRYVGYVRELYFAPPWLICDDGVEEKRKPRILAGECIIETLDNYETPRQARDAAVVAAKAEGLTRLRLELVPGDEWVSVVGAGARDELAEYARRTASDNGVDMAAAVRMMADEAAEVAAETGYLRRTIEQWCAERQRDEQEVAS